MLDKYDIGDKFYGQQGSRNEDGIFELDEHKTAVRSDRADDTEGMRYFRKDDRGHHNGYNNGYKRPRVQYDN